MQTNKSAVHCAYVAAFVAPIYSTECSTLDATFLVSKFTAQCSPNDAAHK